MLDCLLIGDSIATGIAKQSKCPAIAKVGIGTKTVNEALTAAYLANLPKSKLTVLSVGSNDKLPDYIGNHYKDSFLDFKPYVGKDGVHPKITGYTWMSASIDYWTNWLRKV